MTILSIIRAMGIRTMTQLRKHLPKNHTIALVVGICGTYILVGLVALLPHFSSMKAYFVLNFVGSLDKKRHIGILEAYYGRVSDIKISWQSINKLVQDMFINTRVVGDKIRFYGSNGFCLFNYFVRKDNPQIWISAAVLTCNFVCVATIVICYIKINVAASKGAHVAGMNNFAILKRNRRMQRKISILI